MERKNNQKINYQKKLDLMILELTEMKQNNQNFMKPKLLLHACCGPCSSYVIELLSKVFDITIYYYNPNIHPEEEYNRRLSELMKFLDDFPLAKENNVKLVVDEYNIEDYFNKTNVRSEIDLQTESEKGERCRRCYKFRMEKSYKYACENCFDYFTTTLSISPHKDSQKINEIGHYLENEYYEILIDENYSNKKLHQTKFLYSDFKKNGGFLRSTKLSEEYGLWRQDYCGCVYSKMNMKKL